MSTTFQIDGEREEQWQLNLNDANTRTIAEMLNIQLSGPDGRVGFLEPYQCVECMARIEVLLLSDLSKYVRPPSDSQSPRGVASEDGNVVNLEYGPRFISPGTNVEYLARRLAEFYTLFQRALELNKRVVWS